MTESLAADPRLEKDGTVAVLSLGAGENRFNLDSVRAVDALLTEVEKGDYTALVTTAEGKIWSNGFDTPWIAAHRDLGPRRSSPASACWPACSRSRSRPSPRCRATASPPE